MNRIHFLGTAFILLGLLPSCTLNNDPDPLELLLQQEIAQFSDTPEEVGARYLSPAYESVFELHRQNTLWAAQEMTSDEATLVPVTGPDWDDNFFWQDLKDHTWDAGHPMVQTLWTILTTGKQALISSQIVLDEATPNQGTAWILAERTCLNAYFEAQLIDLFGQVPDVNEAGLPVVYTRAFATERVIDSLEGAIEVLKTRPRFTDQRAWDRMNVATAQTLLARLYLNKKVYLNQNGYSNADLEKVLALTNEIINAGDFALVPDYWSLFDADNGSNPTATQEIMWTSNMPESGGVTDIFTYSVLAAGHIEGNAAGGWNGFATLSEFYEMWNPSDPRFKGPRMPDAQANVGFNVGYQFDNQGDTLRAADGTPINYTPEIPASGPAPYAGVRPIKYEFVADTLLGSTNRWVITRLAEVYLMKAEALYRLGRDGEAVNAINELRAARTIKPIGSVDEEILLEEYGLELWWEGHRRSTQVRFGTFGEANSVRPGGSDEVRTLFPIPRQSLDLNPLLQQNPGY